MALFEAAQPATDTRSAARAIPRAARTVSSRGFVRRAVAACATELFARAVHLRRRRCST
jgi:hypothetical protein